MVRLWVTISLLFPAALGAADEEDFYEIVTIPVPEQIKLEVGGIATLDDGRLAVSTRRGEVWIIEGAYDRPPENMRYTLFASGLHEALGLLNRPDGLYAAQRSELTRITDTDGDGEADLYETVAKGWGVSGNYHEFVYGPKEDHEGNLWITTNIPMPEQPGEYPDPSWRGWGLKVTPSGELIPVVGGMRSPSGIGVNAEGAVFYTDQQGNWMGAGPLIHMKEGVFAGHPYGLVSADLPGSPLERPDKIPMGEPRHVIKEEIPSLALPAVWFPYEKMGQSATDIVCDQTGGRFGPFETQLFIGDFTLSRISRVFLEKVNGEYQGACFPFRKGFQCAVFRLGWGEDGSLFAGETNRGWNSLGGKSYGLQRLVWTGITPFEVHEMRAEPDGFTLTFTKPVDPASAGETASYTMVSYTFLYHSAYGSDEVEKQELEIMEARVAEDLMSVDLLVEGLREGFVHELRLEGLRSSEGEPLLHPEAYYTLNYLPASHSSTPERR